MERMHSFGVQATASSKRSKRSKRKHRRKTEPPTNSNQIDDQTTQAGLILVEKGIETANNRTIGINTEFPGFMRAFGMQMRGVSTPPKRGQLPKDERERKKTKIDLYGDGYQDEYFAKSPNVVAKYNNFLKALNESQNFDFEIHPRGSTPPTQAFRKARSKEPRYWSLVDLDAKLDASVEQGLAISVEYKIGTI